jgi:sugar phosphate isomerase/epimerase
MGLYLSAFCVGFRDYKQLGRICCENKVGAELTTYRLKQPDLEMLLEENLRELTTVPITMHGPFTEICCGAGSGERAQMEERIEHAFAWCHRVHATSIVLHTHENLAIGVSKEQLRRNARSSLLWAAQRAQEEHLRLNVENVGYPARHNVLFDAQEYVELIEELPQQVGALLDTGHGLANGWNLYEVVEKLGSRLRGVHLHNNDGTHDQHLPLFTPGLAYSPRAMEELLRQIGRQAPEADWILEYAPGLPCEEEQIKADLMRIRQIKIER